jgi:hypothetical protein
VELARTSRPPAEMLAAGSGAAWSCYHGAMTPAATKLDTSPSTEPSEATPEPQARGAALAELVARIGDDARRDPEGYLGRTVVPEGGE